MFKKEYFKIYLFIAIFLISFATTIFFIVRISLGTQFFDQNNYDIDTGETIDENSLIKPDFIFKSFEKKELCQSISIKPELIYGDKGETIINYQAQFNQELFQYLFLRIFIRTLAQWKTNDFSFSYTKDYQKVWVMYDNTEKLNYLNWYFIIRNNARTSSVVYLS